MVQPPVASRTLARRTRLPALTLLAALGVARGAAAQESVCPEGNLLAGVKVSTFDRAQRMAVLNDNKAPAEGSYWDGPNAAVLQNEASYVEFDLGRVLPIVAATLQGDNNDTYELQGSEDGQTYKSLWSAPMADGQGMRQRTTQSISGQARFLRVGFGRGDGFYSIGEVQVFCAVPARWPPALQVLQEAKPEIQLTREHWLSIEKLILGVLAFFAFWALLWPWAPGRRRPPPLWVAVGGALGNLGVALWLAWDFNGFAALLLLAVGGTVLVRQRRRAGLEWKPWLERGLLWALVVSSGLTWINFGTFHGSRVVHLWDTMHYYVGSKYFRENGYDLMYQCAAIAEVDDGRKDEVLERKYRILRDNRLVPAQEALADEPLCRQAFTPERWAAFRQDLRMFRDLMSPGWFKDAFKDHGYNASPPWTLWGSTLANLGWNDHVPPPELAEAPSNTAGKTEVEKAVITKRFREDRDRLASEVLRLAMIDFALYAAIFLLLGWAFGLPTMALSAVVWAVGHPWAYYWTGGGFGRVAWLFSAVAGLALLKKGYPLLAGALLSWSALDRVFPASLAGGVALRALQNLRRKVFEAGHVRLAIGAVAGIAVVVTLSLPVVGGIQAYPEFFQNSLKHRATPLTNHMGLPTLMAWHPYHVARVTKDNRADDPFFRWKELRRSDLHDRQVLYWGVMLGLFLLVGYVGKELKDWEVTALSVAFTFGLFELTCYYYNFMLLLAPFCLRKRSYALALLGMATVTQASSLAVGWFDELYQLESLLVAGVIGYILFDLWRDKREAAMALVTTAAVPQKPAVAAAGGRR